MAAAITLALDLGSTSIKAGVMDAAGELQQIETLPAPEIYALAGRYESDASAGLEAVKQLLQKYRNSTEPLGLGLSTQRSSFLIWNKANGRPVTPLVSWQDTRGAASCKALRHEEALIQKLTGLRLAPYYFAPKVRQLLKASPDLRSGLEQGSLLIGTLDTFVIWHESEGRYHIIDETMAARTLLMAIDQRQWSPVLCELFSIPQEILPEIYPSSDLNIALTDGLVLQASAADQSAAVIAGIKPDQREALVNLGTGGFVICYPNGQKNEAATGYLKTLTSSNGRVAIEGTLNAITAALSPFPYPACALEDLASVPDVFCIPEPNGVGSPYFYTCDGIIFSAPVAHLNAKQIAGLLLEGIVFRVVRILEDFQHLYGVERVYLAGGLTRLGCLQQGIALCSGSMVVYSLLQKESSLRGAALLAANMPPAYRRQAVKIEARNRHLALPGKYRRWKIWFDRLMASSSK
ncbi:MAG: carbohydrate kinase [Gammaproteobacteria bacterium HGW-Gammaproteobacteria-3]|nr:MAG: carbohydrate kinase [Gammaproteobacteria bacterium HGW-Gammaproteobacteria-3]